MVVVEGGCCGKGIVVESGCCGKWMLWKVDVVEGGCCGRWLLWINGCCMELL